MHAVGVEDVTVDDLGCDFLVSGTHKWLFGPRGTGIVWGRTDAWAAVHALIPAFEPASFAEWRDDVAPEPMSGVRFTPGGYHSFEHRWALSEAFRVHLDVGKDRVEQHTHAQATQLKQGLAEIGGITPVTPADAEMSSGLVCFDVDGTDPSDVMGRLAEAGFNASITPHRDQHVRIGTSIVTSPDGSTASSRPWTRERSAGLAADDRRGDATDSVALRHGDERGGAIRLTDTSLVGAPVSRRARAHRPAARRTPVAPGRSHRAPG